MSFRAAFKTSYVGTFINRISQGKLLPRKDQCPNYQPPSKCLLRQDRADGPPTRFTPIREGEKMEFQSSQPSQDTEDGDEDLEGGNANGSSPEFAALDRVQTSRLQGESQSRQMTLAKAVAPPDIIVVGWRGPNDPENPQNWSKNLKILTTAVICYLTFSVYMGSAIYVSSVPGVMEKFQVGNSKALLGLSLYVLAYGIGPVVLSPLSEIAAIGRNGVYTTTLLLFVILGIPCALATNFSTLMAMRFWTGFLAAPALATGGASISDIYSPMMVPYAISIWAIGAVAGPVLAPAISGYAAQNLNWRWPLWILLINGGVCLLLVAMLLPETSAGYILLARARRLRKITGNPNIRSQSEIDLAATTKSQIAYEALVRPFVLCLEPVVFFASIYLGFVYALLYTFFESYEIVFGGVYGFNLGEVGLAFLGQAVSACITLPLYLLYLKYVVGKNFKRTGVIVPEDRLDYGIFGSFFIPVSLFMFGWTSRESIHWMVPIVATMLYLPGIFLIFQSMLVYLPMSYPLYAASILASNDLIRSSIAAAFPLFARPMYLTLGIGPACSLLGGISIIMIPPMFLIKKYGATLRQKSKNATA